MIVYYIATTWRTVTEYFYFQPVSIVARDIVNMVIKMQVFHLNWISNDMTPMIQTIWQHDAAVAGASVSVIIIPLRSAGIVFKLAGAQVTLPCSCDEKRDARVMVAYLVLFTL